MKSTTEILARPDGVSVHVYRWEPDEPPKGVVQIAHGIAEHAGRYERFARALTEAGYAAYASDHRGHGATAGSVEATGAFAPSGGWGLVVDDLRAVTDRIREEHPGLPVFLLGHSMGGILARSYAARHGDQIDGLVLVASPRDPGLTGVVGRVAATVEGRLRGRGTRSPFLNTVTFLNHNKGISPVRTRFDWLSRDPDEVDKYVADPYCGWVGATSIYGDMVLGLQLANRESEASRVRKDLPIHLASGDGDPVGAYGKGPRATAALYRRVGVRDVTSVLYPGARHELLNETNRDAVTADLIAWLDAHL